MNMGWVICRPSLSLNLSGVFRMIKLELWFGELEYRGKLLSLHSISDIHDLVMCTAHVDLDHSPETGWKMDLWKCYKGEL